LQQKIHVEIWSKQTHWHYATKSVDYNSQSWTHAARVETQSCCTYWYSEKHMLLLWFFTYNIHSGGILMH
jgi:hypothetical protein